MPSAFKSPARNEINPQKENGFEAAARGEFSFEEDVFARLKVAQDSLIEDLECKIVVSRVVHHAVLSGILRALEADTAAALAGKDEEIAALEKAHGMQLGKMSGECLEKMKANELVVLEKERELCRMAESLVDLTFRLQGESLNNLALEKKIREVEARDGAKQRNVNRLVEEIEGLKRERNEEVESLKRELRIKETRYSEQLEEIFAENETRLAALRVENSEKLAKIEAANENASIEAMEKLRVSLEEQKKLEVEILAEVYEGEMMEKLGDEKISHETEVDLLVSYYDSLVSDFPGSPEQKRQGEAPDSTGDEKSELSERESDFHGSPEQKLQGEASDFIGEQKSQVSELEKEIILECLSGFSEDLKQALEHFDLEPGRFSEAVNQARSGRKLSRKQVAQAGYWRSRSLQLQQKMIESRCQHQGEMDVLMEFFVGKLRELQSESKLDACGDGDLQRENARLRREKDQVLIDKTEEMFRLKRDFFKELDKQKMESDEFARKHSRKLEKKQQRSGDQSDSESSSQSGDSTRTEYERKFTEQFPELVSDLQNEIERLMFDTGIAGEGEEKPYAELQEDFDVLSLKYGDLVKVLEVERQKNDALTGDLQELEHNVELSNGELERLLRQVEVEKIARIQKEAELQTIKSDVTLLRRQMEAVLGQLESERCLKKRMQSDSESLQGQVEMARQRIESLQKELENVLRVKASVSEQLVKLRSEVGVLRGSLQRGVEKQGEVMVESLAGLKRSLDEKEARLRKLNDRLAKYGKLNRRKTSSFLLNLQRAEEEVDLLGDENDYLVGLLEKVFMALENYSHVLQHYPGIADLSQLIKRELVSRIE